MRRGRRRRRAENATGRPRTASVRRPRRQTGAATNSCGGWEPRKAWRRRTASPASKLLPFFDAVAALGIRDGDETHDAAVAAVPVPREVREGAAAARHLVDVAADILDAEDAGLEQDAVHRLPLGEILLPVATARPLAILLGEMRMQRPVALRAYC